MFREFVFVFFVRREFQQKTLAKLFCVSFGGVLHRSFAPNNKINLVTITSNNRQKTILPKLST